MANKQGRPSKPILDPELVAAKLVELNGNISAIARIYGVSRTAVQQLIKKRISLQEVLSDSREGMLDNVESSLYRAALAGEAWAVCFFLKTQGRGRGYLENAILYELQEDLKKLREQVKAHVENAKRSRSSK